MYFTVKDIDIFKDSEKLLQKIEKVISFMEEQGFTVEWKSKDHILENKIFHIFIEALLPAESIRSKK